MSCADRLGLLALLVPLLAPPAFAQSSSVLAQAPTEEKSHRSRERVDPARDLHGVSWFTIPAPEPRAWRRHDLVQIIIRETSSSRSRQAVDLSKEYESKAAVRDFPRLTFDDLIRGILQASENASPARLNITSEAEFKGDGRYQRQDEFSARLTAEVIEVLPNGNLVLEARTYIQTDKEASTILLSGVCDPRTITATGTILSNQLFDLRVIKLNEGELKRTTQKGIIPRVLETIFAF